MLAGMEIRHATVADAKGIAVVHVRGWQAVYRGAIPQNYLDNLDPAQRAENWVGYLTAQDWPRSGTLVATSGADIVGFAGFGPSRDKDAEPAVVGEVRTIYLLPDHWGAGLGRRLMDTAVATLREAGYREATLWVLDKNERAQRFYAAVGWRPDGTIQEDLSHGLELRELRYRRSL